MATITTRSGKGSTLTQAEVDANFTNLNSDKIELTNLSVSTASASGGGALSYNNSTGVLSFTPAVAGTTTTINNNADNRVITGSGTANTLEGESNFTFDGTTVGITTTSTDDALLITTTEDSSTAAPVITLKRNSASPADSDYLGQLKFKGENDADQEVVYAKMTGKISDASDTTEDGLLEFTLKKAGSNNIGARLTSTQLKLLNGTTQSIEATPGSFTNPLLHLKSDTSGYNFSHMKLEDSGDQVVDITGRKHAGNGRFQYFLTFDPDGGENRTGAFVGDYALYASRNPANGNFDVDVFGATNEHNYSVFSDGADSYAYKPFNLNGSEVRLKSSGTTKLTVASSSIEMKADLDMDSNDIKLDGGTLDLEGGSITSTGGDIAFQDNMTLDINSAGTVTLGVTNTSATGSGNRVTVGTPSSAVHSSGDLMLARRATASGYQELFKVSSTGTAAGQGIVVMNNIDALSNQDTGTPSNTSTPTGYIELLINGTQRFIPFYT